MNYKCFYLSNYLKEASRTAELLKEAPSSSVQKQQSEHSSTHIPCKSSQVSHQTDSKLSPNGINLPVHISIRQNYSTFLQAPLPPPLTHDQSLPLILPAKTDPVSS